MFLNNLWFQAKDVAIILGNKNTNDAIKNIEIEDKVNFENIGVANRDPWLITNKRWVYINKSGIYSINLQKIFQILVGDILRIKFKPFLNNYLTNLTSKIFYFFYINLKF